MVAHGKSEMRITQLVPGEILSDPRDQCDARTGTIEQGDHLLRQGEPLRYRAGTGGICRAGRTRVSVQRPRQKHDAGDKSQRCNRQHGHFSALLCSRASLPLAGMYAICCPSICSMCPLGSATNAAFCPGLIPLPSIA